MPAGANAPESGEKIPRKEEGNVDFGKSKAAVLVAGLAMATALCGQWTTGRIVGNVQDEGGTYLRGVTVTVTNIKSNAVTTTVTGKKKGAFRVSALEPGIYQVSFDLEGYESHTVSGIQLTADQSATLRIKLKKKAPPAEAGEN